MKVAIVGSRDYPAPDRAWDYVKLELHWSDTLVTGGARGIDKAAEDAARDRRLSRIICEPQAAPGCSRKVYVAALFTRNAEIVDTCDRLVAFWDGESRGTLNAIDRAQQHGKPVLVFGPDGEPMKRGASR